MATIEVHENEIEYYGHRLRVLAVHIDGELVSDSFQLFDASTETMASHICEECYCASGGAIASCGFSNIAARKHGDRIYWFLTAQEHVTQTISKVPLHHVWSFSVENYESQLHSSTDGLPGFNSADIQMILGCATIYPPELGLYTVPDIEDDPQGRHLLDVITQSITYSDLSVCRAPDSYRTIRIGIETKGIPETVIQIGMVEHRCAIRFVTYPSFPLWLTSNRFHDFGSMFVA